MGNKVTKKEVRKAKYLTMLTDFFNELPDDLTEEKHWTAEDIHKAMQLYNAIANTNYYMNLKSLM